MLHAVQMAPRLLQGTTNELSIQDCITGCLTLPLLTVSCGELYIHIYIFGQ